MGKKAKRKHARKYYCKSEFKDIICEQCKLCPEGTDPIFCFEDVYKGHKDAFMYYVYPSLIKFRKRVLKMSSGDYLHDKSDSSIHSVLEKSFCDSNYCGKRESNGKSCEYSVGCLSLFRKQLQSAPQDDMFPEEEEPARKTKKSKRQRRYVPEVYPTFFCSDGFIEEVNKVGDNTEEQNKNKEFTRDTQTKTCGETCYTQSQMA